MPARETFPRHLGILAYNTVSGRYEATEKGMTYHMTLAHTKLINQNTRSMAIWYDNLDRFIRAQVWITEMGYDN